MLRVFEPNIRWREALAVARQVLHRRVSPGEKVAEFEAMLCAETGAKHAICCNSGTTALMLSLMAVNPERNAVRVPSYTFQAAANAARLCGMGVCQGMIDGISLCLSCDSINDLDGALVFVSHNGDSRGFARSIAIARECEVPHIHDAAQSLGCDVFDMRSHATTLSFSGPKVVTTGQGGCVLTNRDSIADQICGLCDHGGGNWRKTRIHEGIGGNFRMSDVNAAIGVAQMKRLPELLGIRRQRFAWYREHFPDMLTDGWCCLVRTSKATECIATLRENGYEALQPYRPLQESIPYRHLPVDTEAVKAADELIYLGNHWRVTKADVDSISRIIKRIDPCATGN